MVAFEPISSEFLYSELFRALDVEGKDSVHADEMYMVSRAFGWSKA